MKIYEIKLYIDGGPNDRGTHEAYVQATSPIEAKKKYAKGKKNYNDIVNTGFYQAHEISQKELHRRIEEWEEIFKKYTPFIIK